MNDPTTASLIESNAHLLYAIEEFQMTIANLKGCIVIRDQMLADFRAEIKRLKIQLLREGDANAQMIAILTDELASTRLPVKA